jgi:hypothetical protein
MVLRTGDDYTRVAVLGDRYYSFVYRFFKNGPINMLTSIEPVQDINFLRYLPDVHWSVVEGYDPVCGFCKRVANKACAECARRRNVLVDLRAKAVHTRYHTPVDICTVIVGRLAAIAAGILIEMPGLL